jgi:hypothetical protein
MRLLLLPVAQHGLEERQKIPRLLFALAYIRPPSGLLVMLMICVFATPGHGLSF